MIDAYRSLLASFPRYAERGWRGSARLPFFGDGSASESGLRSAGNFVFTAALLSGSAGEHIGLSADERERLRQRASATIAYMTASHRTGDGHCEQGGRWGLEWQSSWWTSRMALGAALLGDGLASVIRSCVERVVIAEAGRQLSRTPPSGLARDTKAEENAWDCEVLGAALALYPLDARALLWRDKLSEFAMNSLSTATDQHDDRLVDGKPVREWNCSVNLHPALQIENHGAYHFCYIASPLHSLTWTIYALLSAGQQPAQALDHNFRALWESCLHSVLDNRFAYISGQDWARYTYGTYFMQPVLALLHGRDGDARALFVEQRRLDRLREEQRANDDGSFFGGRVTHGVMTGQSLKYETDCYANVALAYLLHDHFRPQVEPLAPADFFAGIGRRQISHETLTASARAPDCFISFSWSTLYTPDPLVLFVPNGCDDDVEWSPGNLVGRVQPFAKFGEPLYVQSMLETPGGFHVQGGQQLLDRDKSWLLDREIELDADVERRRVGIRCTVRTRRKAWMRLCEGISLFLPNDLFNGNTRALYSDTGLTELNKPAPLAPPTGRVRRIWAKVRRELGRDETLRRCGERWVNIDDRIGIILRTATPGLWVSEGPANSGPDSLFCHRIVAPRTRRWFRASAGETLLDTHILVMAGTADETRAAAEALDRGSAPG